MAHDDLKARGHFSIVDVPTFREVCQRTDADTAAVYLCLSMGTDRTGLRSSWGREAIRQRLAMSWRRVDRCISTLEQQGFIEWPDKGQRKVSIQLHLAETRPKCEGFHAGIERARNGVAPRIQRERKVAAKLERDGWLNAYGAVIEQRPMVKAYLPLSLAGDAKGMPQPGCTSILERLRKARDPLAFLLLVQMYAAQDLLELNGVDRRFLWLGYDTEEIACRTASRAIIRAADHSQWTTFCEVTRDHRRDRSDEDAQRYFERVGILRDAGALEHVICVVEDEKPDAAAIYPLGVIRHGKLIDSDPEHSVGQLAIGAALAIMGDAERLEGWLAKAGTGWLVPVDRLYRRATIRGVPRLVARPRTRATKLWQAERLERCREWAEYFTGIIAENAPEMLNEDSALRKAVDFKETSRRHQRTY